MEDSEKQMLYECFELVQRLKDELNKEIPVNLKSSEIYLTVKADPVSYNYFKVLDGI